MEFDVRSMEAISQLDLEQGRERASKLEARRREIDAMTHRHADCLKALQEKAMERISTVEAKDLTPADALKWLEAGIKLERLMHKLPNVYAQG